MEKEKATLEKLFNNYYKEEQGNRVSAFSLQALITNAKQITEDEKNEIVNNYSELLMKEQEENAKLNMRIVELEAIING